MAGALPARNSPIIASSVEEAEKSKIFEIIQGFPTNLRMPFESLLNDSNEERYAVQLSMDNPSIKMDFI